MNLQSSQLPQGQTVVLPSHLSCPLCHGEYKVRGFYSHLKNCGPKHGMNSRTDYETAHPMTLYSPAHQFAAKWFSLAKFSITQFGLMDYAGQRWCHIDAGKPKSWYRSRWSRKPETGPLVRYRDGRPLLKESFYQFKKHLQGKLTLGIWPDMDNSFTIIDLDDEQVHHLPELVHRLKQMDLHHYVEFSGKKGYHIWIFWNEILSNRELISFNDALCEGITQDRNVWPFKQSLVKLPLGLHRETSRLACFVNEKNVPVPPTTQFTYFLSIRNNTNPGPLPGHSVAAPAPSRSVQSRRTRCKSSSSGNTRRTIE